MILQIKKEYLILIKNKYFFIVYNGGGIKRDW